jgi:hypothetical protein
MVRLNGSQVVHLNQSVALIGVDGWADGLGGEGPATKARINDFYQILDFATDPEPQVFRAMKERARRYARALKPSLLKALNQYQTTIIATHVPPYEGAACTKVRRALQTISPSFHPRPWEIWSEPRPLSTRGRMSWSCAAIRTRRGESTAMTTFWYSPVAHATAFPKSGHRRICSKTHSKAQPLAFAEWSVKF